MSAVPHTSDFTLLHRGLLDPALDAERLHTRFAAQGYLQIENGLRPEVATRLHRCLAEEVPWSIAYRDEDGPKTIARTDFERLSPAAQDAFWAQTAALAETGYQFVYDTYMMISAYLQKRHPDLFLNRIVEQVNSRPWLEFWRTVTGDREIIKTYVQASRYIAGYYLKNHNDYQAGQERRFAVVINLSRDWEVHWGGLFQALDDKGDVKLTLTPKFNSINMFKIPAPHCVSPVADYVTAERLALVCWLRADRNPD